YREGGKVRQQVMVTLGRVEELVRSGTLDSLIEGLVRYSERLRVVDVVGGGMAAREARAWGPTLIFDRLWREQGLPDILRGLVEGRKFGFDVERVVFALVLQRLCRPGSDLQGAGWLETVEGPGLDGLALQHLYRATGFLAENRGRLEQALFDRERDLFTQTLDVVFMDTTSLYVYRDEETAWRKRGYSRDRRSDLPQFVLGVVVTGSGWPISWEIFPGNTADPVALKSMVSKLRERFQIGKVIVVADRGMISQEAIRFLEEHPEQPLEYILGCRMRRQKEVREQVVSRAGRYKSAGENLGVKEVRQGGKRYIICRNPQEAEKDAQAREQILRHIEEALAHHGAKSLIGNKGYARYLKVARGSVTVNERAVKDDALLDGKFVLRTNTELPAEDVAKTYKSLWRVERTFREQKSTLEVRPIYHHRDDTSIGHIVASFLALRLEVDLQRRLDERQVRVSWPDLMRDLQKVQSVLVDLDGKRYRLRTDLKGTASAIFAAVGVRPPSQVELLASAS
ncbi:MAG TPA: IS1634 family transposase, partial [bacterium]|nr:IS1634 family transposase [bacterium]